MKFRIARSRFLEGLKSVQNIVAGKGTLPILNNVMLTAVGKELTMMTTDLDISIKSVVECEVGEAGIIQVLSSLPHSYPGHSLLTEDKGIILGEDDCHCGRKGKYLKVLGRISQAELRGCSDTFEGRHKSFDKYKYEQ